MLGRDQGADAREAQETRKKATPEGSSIFNLTLRSLQEARISRQARSPLLTSITVARYSGLVLSQQVTHNGVFTLLVV